MDLSLPGVRVVRLDTPWEAALQRFFEANPLYFHEVLGEPPAADAAREEIQDKPPADFSYSELFLLGFVQEDGELMVRRMIERGIARETSDGYVEIAPYDLETLVEVAFEALGTEPDVD